MRYRGGFRVAVSSAVFLSFFIIQGVEVHAETNMPRYKGRILLQVLQNGEAWYVKPSNGKRVYMGRPDDAFRLMRQLGVGISNADLNKIPVADANLLASRDEQDGDWLSAELEKSFSTDPAQKDTDADGFDDKTEILGGFDPLGQGRLPIDKTFSKKKSGFIFLQVQSAGEAWYVNPIDAKRYYLGRPYDALQIMKTTGLGISNSDLYTIKEDLLGYVAAFDLPTLDAGARVSSTQVRSISRTRRSTQTDTVDATIHFVGELTLKGTFLRDEKCLTQLDEQSQEILPRAKEGRSDLRICFTNTAQLERAIEKESIPLRSIISLRVDNLILTTDGFAYATYTAEFLDFTSAARETVEEFAPPTRSSY